MSMGDRGDAAAMVTSAAAVDVFSADPRALRRRRFRRARTVTLGEGVQTSSSASSSQGLARSQW